MKRTIGILVTFLALGMVVSYAQEDGFWTRCVMRTEQGLKQVRGYIECWRSSNQSPNPELVGIRPYVPPSQDTYYIHWGYPEIEYGWDYSFIGWRVEHGDTLFSDYTAWTPYDTGVCDTFDLLLQYSTTRPTPPPRP